MSIEKFDDECPGCKPVLADPDTLKPLPPDSPPMMAVNTYWETTTKEEREAFHRVCCLNSRAENDLVIVGKMQQSLQTALDSIDA